MANSPEELDANVVSYEIKADGTALPDSYNVLSVTIIKEVNKISTCEIVLTDGDPANEDFPVSEASTLVPGVEIEVLLGYDQENTSIFKGIVLKQSISTSSDSGTDTKVEVTAKDKAVKMTVGRKNAYYVKKKDSDIMSTLIGNSGASADVSSTSKEWDELIQYYATDWDFLISRAEFNGMLVTTDAGTVSVKAPSDASDCGLEVTYGDDLYEFEGTIDATDQFSSVECSAWDYTSQAIVSGSASITDSGQGNLTSSTLADVLGLSSYEMQSPGPMESDSLETWAKAQISKSKYAKIQGKATFQGNASPLPGTTISLQGMGDRYNGTAFISGVTHNFHGGDWVTEVNLGSSAEWFSEKVQMQAPLAAGRLPGIDGLYTGTVKQIDSDEKGEFRVLVEIPLIQTGTDGVWARMATFYATNNAGCFFYPETGDEVVVSFLNNDPSFPIILGSLYNSSSKASPYTPDDTNSTKAFVTNAQIKIEFDDENKVLTITTPGKNQMIYSDEDESITIKDQNSNSIEMSSSGITIKSASDMTIKAAQSISIEAGTTLDMKGSSSASLSSTSISVKADADVTVEGSASAKFSSSGTNTIKGAMVMIN